MPLKFIKLIALVAVFLIGTFIWFIIDSTSPRHFLGVYPITDASQQKEGSAGFLLPKGSFVIEVLREDFKSDDELVISYNIEVPAAGIKILKESAVKLRQVQVYPVERIEFKDNATEGILRIKVLSPSKGKVSVGLATDPVAGM